MKRCLLLGVLFGAACHSETPGSLDSTYKTAGTLNCRFWNDHHSRSEHVMFVAGLVEASILKDPDIEMEWPEKSTFGEITDGLSQICASPYNARIPMLAALDLFGRKVSGASKADIEKRLELARSRASEVTDKIPAGARQRPAKAIDKIPADEQQQ